MPSHAAWLLLLAAAQAGATLWLYKSKRDIELALRTELTASHKLQQDTARDAARKDQLRQDERRGRVSAEKELRRVMNEKLDTRNGHYVQSLGEVRSCFHGCLGTPRQGLFAPATRGEIEFKRSISPDTLIGLEQFSHVWIVFVFHRNTNGKNTRAHEGLRSDSHRHTFKAKITPPRLKERVGIFCTRTPHRPNPIGITLAKIEAVDSQNRVVRLSSLDIIDGTPVLDIKPYVPAYDAIPDASVAPWVSADLSPTVTSVKWSSTSVLSDLEVLAPSTRFYHDAPSELRSAIEQVLQADVRSKDQTKRRQHADNQLVLDAVLVRYRVVTHVGSPNADGDANKGVFTRDGDCDPCLEHIEITHVAASTNLTLNPDKTIITYD